MVGAADVDGLLAVGDARVVAGRLKVGGGLVEEERHVGGVVLGGGLVVRDGNVKVALLVRHRALLLLLQRLALVVGQARLRRRCRRRLGLLGLGGLGRLLLVLGVRVAVVVAVMRVAVVVAVVGVTVIATSGLGVLRCVLRLSLRATLAPSSRLLFSV